MTNITASTTATGISIISKDILRLFLLNSQSSWYVSNPSDNRFSSFNFRCRLWCLEPPTECWYIEALNLDWSLVGRVATLIGRVKFMSQLLLQSMTSLIIAIYIETLTFTPTHTTCASMLESFPESVTLHVTIQ